MAEKKKYNSILVSGRKDETLTYSRYVKDEESGESVKESLNKKVNITDELTTQQIKDGAITNEKMAAGSVGNTNLQDGSVSNEKLEDGSITNEKLSENSITKDKLKDNTIGVEKLDPELRQTINAATGLPDDLVETIQNVDDTLKDHQSQLDDKQSQIDDKQQQITANDEDISLLQTRSTQMEETIKGIAATGGASMAIAVTYNNDASRLNAVNAQAAIDEVSSIAHFAKRGGVVNISTNYNSDHIVEVLTLSQALSKVPETDRVLGFQGKYLASDGWHTIIYTGNSLTDWVDTTKWTDLESEMNTITDSGILFNRVIHASDTIWLPINANNGKYLRLQSVSDKYSVYFYTSDKNSNLGSATIPPVGHALYSIIPDNAAWVRIFASETVTISMMQGSYISNAPDWLRENEVSAIGFTEYNFPPKWTKYYHIGLIVGKSYYIKHSAGDSISAKVGSIASVDASQPLTFIQGKAEFTAREGDEFIKIYNDVSDTTVEIYGEEKEATLQYDGDYSATEKVVANMDDVVDIAWEHGNINQNGEEIESNIRIRTPFLKGGILISNRDYLSIGFKVFRYNMRTMALVDYTTYDYYHNIYLPEGFMYRLVALYYNDTDITTFDLLKVTWYNVMKDSLVQDFSFTKMRIGAGETITFDLPLIEGREYEVNALTEDTTISVKFLDADDNVILRPFTPSYADNTNGDAKITFIAPSGLVKMKVYSDNALGGFSLTSKGSALHRLNNIETDMLPLPAHWQKHIERKMAEIKNYDVTCGRYGDSFIFVTDIHAEYNYLHSPALIRHIIRNSSVGKVVCGGDIINGFGIEGDANGLLHYDLWMKPMAFTKQIMVRGNHDNFAIVNGSNLSANGYYGLFLKPIENIYNKERQIYYHFDNEVQKIRYIVLDTADNEGTATDVAYSQQIEWIKNVIAEKGADWTIVVFTHIFYTGKFTDNDISKPILSSYAKPLTDALDEVNRNPSLPLVACVICGHSHNDIITYTDTAIPCISTTCDAAYTSASLYDIQYPTREKGSTTEQAFDVFYINTIEHTIHTVRIGAGINRDFNYPSK